MLKGPILLEVLIIFACILSIIYIFYHPLIKTNTFEIVESSKTVNKFLVFSYANLDQDLCKAITKHLENYPFDPSEAPKCYNNEIISIFSMGRTGNQMWAYASVLSIARQTGLQPYIPSCIRSKLNTYFEHLTIPDFSEIIRCPVKIETFVTSIEEWKLSGQSIILPRYIIHPEKILPWIQDIGQEFTFKKHLKDAAQQTLQNIVKNLEPKNYTFIGVHVRRTDYEQYLSNKYGEPLVDPQFFLNAMEYFKRKYLNIVFIFISDDPKWCFQQFGELQNVYVVMDSQNKTNGAALDMSLMAACNHTIFDYGTFGEWGSILAGGETVCYNVTQNRNKGVWRLMKNWHMMR